MKATRLLILGVLALSSEFIYPQDLEKIKDAKPVTFHGNIGLNLMGYSVKGIPERQNPLSYVFSANARLSIYGIDLPFTFAFSDRQRKFSDSFNQNGLSGSYTGISPKYKWITLHAGYRNVSFSEYTLAGQTFLGGGVELNPGILRLGFIYGRFDRNVSSGFGDGSDTLPRYKRKGFAGRVGIGTAANFFDLIFMRIRDDSTSLNRAGMDTSRLPEQNTVTGFNSHVTILKNLTWEGEAAVSLNTSDLSAKPLLDNNTPSILLKMNEFLMINRSSHYYTALRTSVQYRAKLWSLRMEYKRIDPNYRTMGAYYINSDLEKLTLRPSFSLFKRKLAVNATLGLQKDNLQDTKRATSMRTIGNFNVSFNPSSKFGLDANYGNLSFNQSAGCVPLNDTIKLQQTTHNLTVMPRLNFIGDKNSHMFMLIYTMATLSDKNQFASDQSYFKSQTAQLSYIITLFDSNWSFETGLTYTSYSTFLTSDTGKGGIFGITKSMLDEKLSLNWNNSLLRSNSDSDKGWIINSNFSGKYNIHKNHSARLSIYYTGNSNEQDAAAKSFNEIKGEISYVYTF